MKQLLFFILGTFIFWPLHLIMAFAYGTTTSAEPGWYQELWDRGFAGKFFSILLAPFIFPAVWFMYVFYPIWEELAD